jgi:hypothetical protein
MPVMEAAMIPLGATLAVLGAAVFSLVLAELAPARAGAGSPGSVRTLDPLVNVDD